MAKINEKEIEKLMLALDITREEAIETLQFDNDELDNDEALAIEEKVKETAKAEKSSSSKTKKKGSSLDKVKNQKAKKKVDAIKEGLMEKVNDMLKSAEVVNPQQLTSTKVTFKIGEEYFSLTLTKHKAKPDGYSEQE